MRTKLVALSVAAAAALATPGMASASTVSVDPSTNTAVFNGGSAASNLASQDGGGGFELKDLAQRLLAGDGCVAGPPVSCAVNSLDIHFGNKADRFRGFSFQPISITAGGGRDSIRAAGLYNIVSAGDGEDSVWENGDSIGSVHGDAGDDNLYSFEAPARLHGDAGDDLLVSGPTSFGDQMSGDDGNDEIVATSRGSGSGTAGGGAGVDVIVIDTSSGAWTIDGGDGSDTISGGPGDDIITGGNGNDVIDVSGGGADTVDCGSGRDTVYVDASDTLANCERVFAYKPALSAVAAARYDAAAFVAAMPAIPSF